MQWGAPFQLLRNLRDVQDQTFVCPACGYDKLEEPPWRDPDAVGGGSDEICPNCKLQFGYDDLAGAIP